RSPAVRASQCLAAPRAARRPRSLPARIRSAGGTTETRTTAPASPDRSPRRSNRRRFQPPQKAPTRRGFFLSSRGPPAFAFHAFHVGAFRDAVRPVAGRAIDAVVRGDRAAGKLVRARRGRDARGGRAAMLVIERELRGSASAGALPIGGRNRACARRDQRERRDAAAGTSERHGGSRSGFPI